MGQVRILASHEVIDLSGRLSRKYTDILVNVDSMCITRCPIFLISHQIHGTPNTHFFMFFTKVKIGMCNWCGAICTH